MNNQVSDTGSDEPIVYFKSALYEVFSVLIPLRIPIWSMATDTKNVY
jgi:hypothetical protein